MAICKEINIYFVQAKIDWVKDTLVFLIITSINIARRLARMRLIL